MVTGKTRLRLLMLPLFLSLPVSALAAEWDGEISTDWFDDFNWVADSVPGAGDVVIDTITPNPAILSGGASAGLGTVTVGDSQTGSLTIEDGGVLNGVTGFIATNAGSEGNVTVTGEGSMWNNSGFLYIGYSGIGSLSIEDGATVSNTDGIISSDASAAGAVTVTGEGSTWTSSTALYVGLLGSATLTVEDGGAVASGAQTYIGADPGSVGRATVTGSGSTLSSSDALYVGLNGKGTLTVEDGGTVTNTFGFIGHNSGSEGTVTVSGTDSTWTTNFFPLSIGESGKGTLTIEDGGMVSNTNGTIGHKSGSDGIVTVAGAESTWTNSGLLRVGDEGTGTLTIEDGGTVSSDFGYLGYSSGSEGTATVTGTDSNWTNSGELYIGDSGEGALTIEDGGTVSNTNGHIGYGTNSEGTVMVTGPGSTWTNSGILYVGPNGKGTLTVEDGGLVESANTTIITQSASSTGTLNIGATSGDAAEAPGTLDTPMVKFGAGTGTLVFNHTDETGTYEFAPDMFTDSGTSVIEHHAGFTRLTGDSSGFAQATNIDGGTLAIENMLGGIVNVMSGGTLGGSGVANGDVTFSDGATYLVEMDGTTDDQGLTVQGTATLDGTAMLTGDYASIAGAGDVVILTTDTLLSTTFDGATASSIFLTPTLSYEMDGGTDYVFVSVEQTTDFAEVAKTPNQWAIAGGLDSLAPGNPLYNAVALLGSQETALDAYDQLSGQVHASLNGALIESGQKVVNAVNNRMHTAFGPAAGGSGADYGEAADPANGFWMTGFGNWMSIDATNNTAGMDNDLYGVLAGVDHRIGDYVRLGILGGYSRTNTSVDALASQADADSYTIGLYGGADNGHAALSLGALYTWHSIDSTRRVTNLVTETLNADYDAGSLQLFAEAGYKAAMDGFALESFAGVSYINLKTDAFSETGGISALSSSSQTTSTTFTTLGLRTSADLTSMVSLRGMAGWRHAFGDINPSSTFTIAGSSPFSIAGAPIAEDAAVVEAGIEFEAGENVLIGASYQGQYGDGAIANGINARLLAEF